MEELKFIGQPIIRIDGKEKISGAAIFADDMNIKFLPHGKCSQKSKKKII